MKHTTVFCDCCRAKIGFADYRFSNTYGFPDLCEPCARKLSDVLKAATEKIRKHAKRFPSNTQQKTIKTHN